MQGESFAVFYLLSSRLGQNLRQCSPAQCYDSFPTSLVVLCHCTHRTQRAQECLEPTKTIRNQHNNLINLQFLPNSVNHRGHRCGDNFDCRPSSGLFAFVERSLGFNSRLPSFRYAEAPRELGLFGDLSEQIDIYP